MSIKKHVGVMKNTGVKVAVVFRELPDDPTHCLLVQTDALPDKYKDDLNDFINAKDAQATNDLYEVLQHKHFGDGLHCLSTLHTNRYLQKVKVDQVNMEPIKNSYVSLKLVNETIKASKPVEHVVEDNKPKVHQLPPETDTSKAKSLLLQAELLEQEAKKKREEAYTLHPELRPVQKRGPGKPKNTENQDALTKIERGETRRAYEKKARAEKKVAETQAQINDNVAKKLDRDIARLSDQ